MNNIRIISNSPYIQPKFLDNFEVQYGWVFYNLEDTKKDKQDVEEIFPLSIYANQKKNISIALFKSIEKFFNLFRKSSNIPKIETEKFIFEQIEKNSAFLSKNYSEESLNLKIYVSSGNSLINLLLNKFYSFFSKDNPNISSYSASIFPKHKYILLGNEIFNSQNSFLKNLSQTDNIDFIFFHEFSHSMQTINNQKYEINKTNTSFDYLFSNLHYLHYLNKNPDLLTSKLEKFLDKELLPNKHLVNNLMTLYKEIYADIGSILLTRNKKILEGSYSQEHIENLIEAIKTFRDKDYFYTQKIEKTLIHSHFSSPGIEHLKDIMPPHEKVLSMEEIHNIANQCIEIGITKTIYALIESNQINIPLKTLLSLRLDSNNEPYIEPQFDYFEEIISIKSLLPKKFESQCSENLKKISELGEITKEQRSALIFNGILNHSLFEYDIYSIQSKKYIEDFCKKYDITPEMEVTPELIQQFKEFITQNSSKKQNELPKEQVELFPLKEISSTIAVQKMLQLRDNLRKKTLENSNNLKI